MRTKFSIAMRTVDRAPRTNYVFQTLENLTRARAFASAIPFSLAIFDSGCGSDEFVRQLRDDRWMYFAPGTGKLSPNQNAAAALRWAAEQDAEWVLFLEDDLDFCDYFLESCAQWIDRLTSPDRHLYSLCAAYAEVRRNDRIAWDYPIDSFYGTQAYLLSREDAGSAARFVMEESARWNSGQGHDLMLKKWAKNHWPEIHHFVASCPSFVQHIGVESSLHLGRFHRYQSFPGRNWSFPAPTPAPAEPQEKVEFGVVMTVVERPEQVEWAVQHLRDVYANVPFVLISDGKHKDEYARIAETYGGRYVRGEKLKVPERGAEWWQRALQAGLELGAPYVLKVDPDTRFNRPIASWPEWDCFGTVACAGSEREHVQGGVQGFRREAAERIVSSGLCRDEKWRDAASWAWDPSAVGQQQKRGYLSTDQVLRRLLIELGLQWGNWPEVKSWFGSAPPDWAEYAITHAHKWQKLDHPSRIGDLAPKIEVKDPLVSALMVTGKHPDRAWFVEQALACFTAQTWPKKELLVVNQGGASLAGRHSGLRELMVPPECRLTLGDLRNIGTAACSGEWVLLWDDDDWHAPERIATQMQHAQRDAAVLLRSQVRYSLPNDTAFVHRNKGGIHGTYLHHKDVPWKYDRVGRGEDTKFLEKFSRRIAFENEPGLFVRFVHGTNTWGERHIMRKYAGRAGVIDLPASLAAQLREEILPCYRRAKVTPSDGAK